MIIIPISAGDAVIRLSEKLPTYYKCDMMPEWQLVEGEFSVSVREMVGGQFGKMYAHHSATAIVLRHDTRAAHEYLEANPTINSWVIIPIPTQWRLGNIRVDYREEK